MFLNGFDKKQSWNNCPICIIHPARQGTLKLKGDVILNSRDITYRINSSKLKTLFTSNDEEGGTKNSCCCRSFNKPCIVKAKDNNILTLMIYAYVVQQREQDWYMKTDMNSFASIRKMYEKIGSTISMLLSQFHLIRGGNTVTYFFNISKRVVFEWAPSFVTLFIMRVQLGSSSVIRETLNNEVKNLSKGMFTGLRK